MEKELKKKKKAHIDRKYCVACGECRYTCPKHAIEIVKGSFASVNRLLCVGCRKCSNVCPTGSIEIIEV